ncbi:MAG: nucleoside hydrolase [Blautia sp.]|nr:nucleoside hydrolase [Blautia sp.]
MRKKVIIDCDPGIDDSLAVMLALSMEELEVAGITIVAGNSPAEMGYENILKVLKFMDRLDVPVFIGADRPLKREYINALDTHGPDGLGGSFLPVVPSSSYIKQQKTAAEFISEVLPGGGISVIALGPMTNLAVLAEAYPEAFKSIDTLVSMGGSFKSPGNCSPVAEYNYWCDPDAAAYVYREMDRAGKKIHMVGLDVTRRIVLTPDLLAYMKRLSPHIGSFVEKITQFYFDFHWEWEHIIGCVINDPLAVAYFAQRDLCSGFDSYVQIETQGISIGQSVVDAMDFYRHSPNAVVLTETDPQAFFRLFFTRLLRLDSEPDLLEKLTK